MLLSKDTICRMIKSCEDEMQDMEQFKSRGKGRYVPEKYKQVYLVDKYQIHLGKRLLQMLEKGSYSIDRVIEALEGQDWEKYSISGKAYSGSDLWEILMQKKTQGYTYLLMLQAVYLEDASKAVIEYIRE